MTVRLPVFGAFLLLCMLLTPLAAQSSGPPALSDDLETESLQQAVAHSLNYLRRQPPERTFRLCNSLYENRWLLKSLEDFSTLLAAYANTGPAFRQQVREQFEICNANDRGNLLVTGYYEPEFAGSLTRTATFRYPLYRVPADLISRDGHLGRMDNTTFIPYWSRGEIEKGTGCRGWNWSIWPIRLTALSSMSRDQDAFGCRTARPAGSILRPRTVVRTGASVACWSMKGK